MARKTMWLNGRARFVSGMGQAVARLAGGSGASGGGSVHKIDHANLLLYIRIFPVVATNTRFDIRPAFKRGDGSGTNLDFRASVVGSGFDDL